MSGSKKKMYMNMKMFLSMLKSLCSDLICEVEQVRNLYLYLLIHILIIENQKIV